MIPFQSVNQTWLEAAYAVPTPSLSPWVHRGWIPGCPNALFLFSVFVIPVRRGRSVTPFIVPQLSSVAIL